MFSDSRYYMSVWGQQILTAVFAGQSSYIFACLCFFINKPILRNIHWRKWSLHKFEVFFPPAYSWLYELNEGNKGLVRGKKNSSQPIKLSWSDYLIFFEMEITFSCFYEVIIVLQIIKFIKFLLFVFRLNSKHIHYIEL